jgi:hypothetical protein
VVCAGLGDAEVPGLWRQMFWDIYQNIVGAEIKKKNIIRTQYSIQGTVYVCLVGNL